MTASHPRPTLLSIARDLGVSRATVSNAYNRPDQLSATLRSRILAHAASVGFAGPDPAGRRLRGARPGAVGVLIDQRLGSAFADPAASLILDGVSEVLELDGLGLLIHAGGARTDELAHVRDAAVEAWVVLSLPDGDPAIDAALARGNPMIVLDQPAISGVPLISVEDRSGTAEATKYLHDLGHRRFGVLTMPLVPDGRSGVVDAQRSAMTRYRIMRERLAGVFDEITARGLSTDHVCVVECAANNPEAAAAATSVLMAASPGLTAIIGLSDQVALGALLALQRMDVHVPDQVSVVGFDDAPPAARAYPPLSTVAQPIREKGLATGRYLRRALNEHVAGNPASTARLPVRLVVRESTAGAPW